MYVETPNKEMINLAAVSKISLKEVPNFKGVVLVFYALDGKTKLATLEFDTKEKAKKWIINQIYTSSLKKNE